MNFLLIDVDSWVLAAVLALLMLAAWRIGWRRGRQLAADNRAGPPSKFDDASLALLGLLLAFTFSMAVSKHDQRRQMVVTDSNSIGDFYTCASLLKEPVRGKLQQLLREYVVHRLEMPHNAQDEATLQKKLADIQAMHDRMTALVGEALEPGTPIAVPLVNTLNEVTSSHAARLAAVRDRLPPNIVVLLFLAAILSVLLVGIEQGMAGKPQIMATFAFVILVSCAVWVTLDLNQPYRGLITVSQEPLRQLLAGMGK